MYLHIGNNNIVKEDDLIAIYNINSIEKTEEYKRLIQDLTVAHSLIKDDAIEAKSLIIVKTSKGIIGYISNISSTTIAKRKNFN